VGILGFVGKNVKREIGGGGGVCGGFCWGGGGGGRVASCCEFCDEPSGFIVCWEVVD